MRPCIESFETREMMKATSSKALVIKINLVFFLAFLLFLIVYFAFLFQPSSIYEQTAASLVQCSWRGCLLRKGQDEAGTKVARDKHIEKAVVIPTFLDGSLRNARIGLVNVEDNEFDQWERVGKAVVGVGFNRVSENFEWKHLFPEWIDEEEENEGPSCPEIPMPEFTTYREVDVVVARLPCRYPEDGWARDVFRLQVHLVVANLAVRKARRDQNGTVKLVFLSSCRPMIEIFWSEDLVKQEGDWWVYESDVRRLEEKVSLPVGSCNLALPLWREGTNEEFDLSKLNSPAMPQNKREAYVTVLHSSETYVCGAIVLAQSILKTGSSRELILLHDKSISKPNLDALIASGWKLRLIKRIRNPRAEKDSYNEYNYSKFRLWKLTDYHKLIFIDADIIVLRNLDLLFHFPQMTATGNDGMIFNSGVMVIEPSNSTFRILMEKRKEIISYNGGDQGYLNEIFVWWHRLPRRVNFLKNFWFNTSAEASMKNHLFAADPPKLYSIHYLGLKPWLCYRDYDCNWNIGDQRVYASDDAHRRWWMVHDSMDHSLHKFCGLSPQRKIDLDWDRNLAQNIGFSDGHWRLNISDRRRDE